MSETSLKVVTAVVLSLAVEAWGQTPPVAPLTLRRAAELALERAPGLAAAQAAASESAAAARLAADELQPQAFLTMTPGYSHGLPTAIAGSVPALAGVSLRATLYDRATRVQALQREAESASATAGSERARIDTVRAVLLAYTSCWADERMLPAAQARRQAAERVLEHTLALQAAGRATDLDVEQARLNVSRARLRTLDLQTTRDLDWLELARLTGLTGTPVPPLAEDPLSSLPEVPAGDSVEAARAADPELRAAARSVALLGKAAGLVTGAASPVVEAEAQYARLSRANHYDEFYRRFVADDWSVGVLVALPIWNGGRHRDAAARAAASLMRAQSERSSRASALELEVRRNAWGADRARAGASLAREAVAVAQEALRVARARAGEGRGGADDVAEREIALADAQEEQVRAEESCFAARVELLAVRGDLPKLILASDAGGGG
jgi:outer membrane protein TolC